MDVKVSVIIPIYNVELYVRECLESVEKQSFTDYEVLMVDDGSTDQSGKIAQEYADRYESFRLLHKENGGLSSARNAGLEQAKGTYVCFVDADDYISEDYLQKLYTRAAATDADMVIADYREVDEQGHVYIKELGQAPPDGCMDRRKLLRALANVGECHYATAVVVAWNKLIRTDIMRSHLFPEGKLHEDEFVIMPLLLACEHVEWIPDVVYLYRQRQGSIMQNADAAMRHLDVLQAYKMRIKLCRDSQEPQLMKAFERAYFWNMEIWYYLLRTRYGVESSRLHGIFSRRMWGALLRYHHVFGKRKTMEYVIFAISPEYYLKKYFK